MRIPVRIIVLFTVMSLLTLWIYYKSGPQSKGTLLIKHTFGTSDDNLETGYSHYSSLILDHEFPNCQNRTIYNGNAGYSLPDIVKFIRKYIPPPSDFVGHLKNPCWFANYDKVMSDLTNQLTQIEDKDLPYLLPNANGTKTLYCLPYMYLLGYPKCGTTSLLGYLKPHHEFVKSVRGYGWISNHTAGLINKYPANVKSVFSLLKRFYQGASKIEESSTYDVYNKIIADFSASTSWRQSGFEQFKNGSMCDPPLLLRELQPNAKFVVLLREPLNRLYSAFWFYADKKYKKKLNPEIFSKDVHTFFERLKLCDDKKSMLKCLKEAKDFDNHFKDFYAFSNSSQLLTGFYYLYLLPWLQVFPRKNFLFIRTEDMKKDTRKTLEEVLQFLGMSRLSDVKIDKIQKLALHEQTMLHGNDSQLLLSSSTKKQLRAYFRPFNEKLAELLNDDKFLWDGIE